MADSSSSSKTASPKARQAARQQGRIAISGDLANAVSLTGSFIIVYLFSPRIFRSAADMVSSHLGSASTHIATLASDGLVPALNLASVVGQCLLAILAFVVVAWLVQTGALFAISRISPDLSRVSPSTGVLRLFSVSNVFTAILNLLKIAIVGAASYLYFRSNFETFVAVSQAPVTTIANEAGTLMYHLALICTGTLIVIGAIDYAIKRNRYEASLSDLDDDSRASIRSISNDPSSSQRRGTTSRVPANHELPAPSDLERTAAGR